MSHASSGTFAARFEYLQSSNSEFGYFEYLYTSFSLGVHVCSRFILKTVKHFWKEHCQHYKQHWAVWCRHNSHNGYRKHQSSLRLFWLQHVVSRHYVHVTLQVYIAVNFFVNTSNNYNQLTLVHVHCVAWRPSLLTALKSRQTASVPPS